MRIKHLIEYGGVRFLERLLRALPYAQAMHFGEKLGTLLSLFLPKRKELIQKNLKNAFHDKSAKEISAISDQMWKNLGRTAAEFCCFPQLTAENINDYIIFAGTEHIKKALEKGKGLVLVAAHFTNWEVSGYATQYQFGNLMAIARPMKNPLVENWVQNKRSQGGNKIALHRNAVRTSLKWLKGNNIVAILVDQNLYTGGVFVDFFGRPAATTTLPALLHIRTDCPVLFTHTLRDRHKFVVHYDPPFQFPTVGEESHKLHAYTQWINRRVEEIVRQYPENWFWIHNRWKRQPEPVALSVSTEDDD